MIEQMTMEEMQGAEKLANSLICYLDKDRKSNDEFYDRLTKIFYDLFKEVVKSEVKRLKLISDLDERNYANYFGGND
jgi:hypothetical protein